MNRQIGPFGRITVFGGATTDRIATAASPVIPGASNPGVARSLPGGVSFNVASTLARLDHPVRLVARIGDDQDGHTILSAARTAGVDVDHVGISPTGRSASYYGAFDHQGGLIVGISDMTIYEEMLPATVTHAALSATEDEFWLLDANLPAETLAFLVVEAANTGRKVGAATVSPAKAVRLRPLLNQLTVLFTNRREAAALLGRPWDERRPSSQELAVEISREFTPLVVVTNSGDPLVAASGGEARSFAPLRASVKSVNGAGDALAAGTIHGLALGRTLFESVLTGLATAALTLETEGTVSPLVTRQMLAERIGSRPAAHVAAQ